MDVKRSAQEIAAYVIERYEIITNSNFGTSELKLQKLMYLLQRQSLALTGETLFNGVFEGWIHGPVLPELRYFLELPILKPVIQATEQEEYIIDNVIREYGKYSAWELREITHKESSWKNSRAGLLDSDYGFVAIKLEDIIEDAKKVRLYDYEYDMYLDEFEDFDEEVCV